MLDQNFCNFLEYHLTKAFSYSKDITVKSLWCDGIILPSNGEDLSKKNVNDKKEIVLRAFIGKDEQDEYTLLMKFGSKSLSKYARDLNIEDCIPNAESNGWYVIEPKTNRITIQLL